MRSNTVLCAVLGSVLCACEHELQGWHQQAAGDAREARDGRPDSLLGAIVVRQWHEREARRGCAESFGFWVLGFEFGRGRSLEFGVVQGIALPLTRR